MALAKDPVKEVTTVEEVKTVVKKKEPKKKRLKMVRVAGKKYSFYHPFQNQNILFGGNGVKLELDSWLQAQIDAGHIIEV